MATLLALIVFALVVAFVARMRAAGVTLLVLRRLRLRRGMGRGLEYLRLRLLRLRRPLGQGLDRLLLGRRLERLCSRTGSFRLRTDLAPAIVMAYRILATVAALEALAAALILRRPLGAARLDLAARRLGVQRLRLLLVLERLLALMPLLFLQLLALLLLLPLSLLQL